MGSIIIVMPRSEDADRIATMVQSCGLSFETEVCSSGADVLRKTHARDFGVVICTKRQKDMSYWELAEYLPGTFGMIILTSDLSLETFSDKMVKLIMPLKSRELLATIEMMTEGFFRREKKKKKAAPKRSEKEQKIIDQAKQILMNQNGMSEPEAFRYIQKTSMDCGRNMVESAQMIVLLNGG